MPSLNLWKLSWEVAILMSDVLLARRVDSGEGTSVIVSMIRETTEMSIVFLGLFCIFSFRVFFSSPTRLNTIERYKHVQLAIQATNFSSGSMSPDWPAARSSFAVLMTSTFSPYCRCLCCFSLKHIW
ncbi:hypothetical protein QBC45DRAFT_414204 [Copromyces sp. CBS 386.78]|nr:hypothetical protein QBC45DRAFT_414204 [Copromyces sp. CBS 386.78]